jgi:DNA-binding PadR family transcriptional regulator
MLTVENILRDQLQSRAMIVLYHYAQLQLDELKLHKAILHIWGRYGAIVPMPSQIEGVCSRLENEGLLEQRRMPNNERAFFLTEAGSKIAREIVSHELPSLQELGDIVWGRIRAGF